MKIGLYGKSRRSTNNNLMVCSNIYIFKWIPYIYYFCFPFIFQHLVLLMLPVPWDGSSFCYVFIQCLSQWVIWQRLLDTTVVVKSTRHCQLSLWNRRKFIHVTLVYFYFLNKINKITYHCKVIVNCICLVNNLDFQLCHS